MILPNFVHANVQQYVLIFIVPKNIFLLSLKLLCGFLGKIQHRSFDISLHCALKKKMNWIPTTLETKKMTMKPFLLILIYVTFCALALVHCADRGAEVLSLKVFFVGKNYRKTFMGKLLSINIGNSRVLLCKLVTYGEHVNGRRSARKVF